MYYDLLVKIKNAERAKKQLIQTQFSSFDFAVAKLLAEQGYLKDVQKKNVGKKSVLEIVLKYVDREPALSDFRIVSKPSRRLFSDYRKLRPIKQNYGIAVLSTSSGIMTNREARKRKIGGEYLFEVW